MRTALSIAGSDPTGGAGLQLDLQVFGRFGLHGAAVPTALTVQDTQKVHQVLPVFPTLVLEQIRALLRDFEPAVVKIGMLASDDVLRNVALALAELPARVPVVIDPVLVSSSGKALLERRAYPGLTELFARAALVTPNLHETETLTGGDASGRRGSEAAARQLLESFGPGAVLVKGGHRGGDPHDLLAIRGETGVDFHWLEGPRIEGPAVHGTGCALASAAAAGLALGKPMIEAVEDARAFVRGAIAGAQAVGKGARLLDLACAPLTAAPDGAPS
jgi:hydroxymethylpyrimidine/phosphomethylpyrimidine kinase